MLCAGAGGGDAGGPGSGQGTFSRRAVHVVGGMGRGTVGGLDLRGRNYEMIKTLCLGNSFLFT